MLRLRKVLYGGAILASLAVLYGVLYFPGYERFAEGASAFLEKYAIQQGIRLETITVEGRLNTSAQEISQALAARKGESLFSFDVHLLRRRLVALPWVRSAIVQRRFPDTLYVRLTERTPIALWQHKGKTLLIDDQGQEIKTPLPPKYRTLLKISGEEGARYVPELIAKIRLYPDLRKRLSGAVLNGGRQWDLFMGKTLRIKLPETGVRDALAYLQSLQDKGHLDNLDISSIDIRLSDRTFFYLTPAGVKKHQVSFQQKNR